MARETGELIDWNDACGFGFVRNHSDERFFVHISSIRRIATRPRVGDAVSFERGTGRDRKPAAINVEISGANPVDAASRRRGLPPPARRFDVRPAVAGGLLVLVVAATLLGWLPYGLAAFYPVMGLVSATLYRLDKARAQNGQWRISEASLHLVDICGGIIGGLLAQWAFRHKTSKLSFAVTSFAIAAMHALWLACLCLGLISSQALGELLAIIPG